MEILSDQEAHWDKVKMENDSATLNENTEGNDTYLTGRMLLQMSEQLLLLNCLPSDFIPKVCHSLHNLPLKLAIKAVAVCNSRKRNCAGISEGVRNRSIFLLNR